MSSSHPLGQCLLPVEQRVPQSARFYRVIGRDAGGAVLADLHAFYQLTRSEGLYIPCLLYTSTDIRSHFCGRDFMQLSIPSRQSMEPIPTPALAFSFKTALCLRPSQAL